MFNRKASEKPAVCPYGCGRSVLPSRLAAHSLISAAEHVLVRYTSAQSDAAYESLSAFSQANPEASILSVGDGRATW